MIKNGRLTSCLKFMLAFALGVGTTVAAVYNTFETAAHHASDQERTEQMLQEIRGDVKQLLERVPRYRMPTDGGRNMPRKAVAAPLSKVGG